MAVIPIFFHALQISTMNVIPCTAAADGTLTELTAIALKTLGVFESLRVDFERDLMMIAASDSLMKNYQHGQGDFVGNLSALDKNGKVSVLLDTYFAYDHVKIVAQGTQYGTSGAAQKILTLYASIGNSSSSYQSGPNPTGLTLLPCGILPAWASP